MLKIYYNSLLARLFLWTKGCNTAMFFGFICTKHKAADPLAAKTVQHESIHAAQYAELTALCFILALTLHFTLGGAVWLILAPFVYYIIYFVEAGISWVVNCVFRKRSSAAASDKAYHNSMFEMEAYNYETTPNDIQSRRWFAWIKYFGRV